MRSTSFTNESGFCNNAFDGAITSGFDFINFLGMLLNKGTFEGKVVLSEKSVKGNGDYSIREPESKIYS